MRHRKSIELLPKGLEAFEEVGGVHFKTLAQWETLGARCHGCGRIGWIDKDALQRQRGNQYLINLAKSLRCKECGAKGNNAWVIGKAPRD